MFIIYLKHIHLFIFRFNFDCFSYRNTLLFFIKLIISDKIKISKIKHDKLFCLKKDNFKK